MIGLGEIVAALVPGADEASWHGTIPEDWLQGRTAYGGLSTALALEVALRSADDLPPLRTAQIAFVGPLAGTVTITARVLRRGRNAAFVAAEATGAAGLGLRCTFVFVRPMESVVDHRVDDVPDCPAPGADDRLYRGIPQVPFTRNFEFVSRPEEAVPATQWLRWTRLAARDGIRPSVALLAVADCLPPAAIRLLGKPAPISSLCWQINLLDPAPVTDDGWWLLHARTDHARQGGSSQPMGIWNTAGMKVAEHLQSVALFG